MTRKYGWELARKLTRTATQGVEVHERFYQRLDSVVPGDSSEQYDVFKIIDRNRSRFPAGSKVLDLGAGTGTAYERLSQLIENIEYFGLDVESSPEVSQRTRTDLSFHTYDGRTFPFGSDTFDVVFSRQVLEHVRYPDEVIAEVARVLRPGGLFTGSVSQLEPYHSHSIFNWTPYGLVEVFESHGLQVCELRPGVDGLSLIFRRLFGADKFDVFFSKEGLSHYLVDSQPGSHQERNFEKLILAGHFVWLAELNG